MTEAEALLQAWFCRQQIWFSLAQVQERARQLDNSCFRDPLDILLAFSSLDKMIHELLVLLTKV